MSTLTALLDLLLAPLYAVTSAVLVGWHLLLTDVVGLAPGGGLAWLLSIVGLTAVVRTALVPLFLRQVRAGRRLQLLQPEIAELRRLHGADRERLARETMSLYQRTGTHPLASCLPVLVQAPVLLALFQLLSQAARDGTGHGLLTDALAHRLGAAVLLDRLPIAGTLLRSDGAVGVQVLAAALIAVMAGATYLTQRLQARRTLLAGTTTPAVRQQQRLLAVVLPVVVAVGGAAFPIGVLTYWATSNLWTLVQQLVLARDDGPPGEPARTPADAG